MKPRSPLMGMNSELMSPRGALHIQTEDLGFTRGLLRAQLFVNGAIERTEEVRYFDRDAIPPAPPPSVEELRVQMRALHRSLVELALNTSTSLTSAPPKAPYAEPDLLPSAPPHVFEPPPVSGPPQDPPSDPLFQELERELSLLTSTTLNDESLRALLSAPPPSPYPRFDEPRQGGESLKALISEALKESAREE